MKNKFLQFLSSMRRGAAMLLLLLTCVTHAWADWYISGWSSLTGHDWGINNDCKIVSNTVTFSGRSAADYQFKLTDGSGWYGHNNFTGAYGAASRTSSSGWDNAQLTTTWKSDITFTYDGNGSHNYSAYAVPVLYIAGNGTSDSNGNWCDGKNWNPDSHILSKTATAGKYTVTFDDVAAGDYQFKITDGTWSYILDQSKMSNSSPTNVTLTSSGNPDYNICFSLSGTADVTVLVDITSGSGVAGWKVYVTASYSGLSVEASPAAGGSPTISATSVNKGSSVTVHGHKNTGYDFSSWSSEDGSFGNASNEETTFTPTANDAVATATYTPSVYSITYYDKGGGSYSGSNSASLPSSYTYGTGVALVNGVKAGYSFEGWYTASDCSSGKTTSIGTSATGAKTFYANWEELDEGSVTLTAGTGGEVSKDNSNWSSSSATITGITSDQAVNIYARPSTGYTFNTWTKTSGTGSVKTNSASGAYNAKAYSAEAVTASFNERMSTLTTSCAYDAGTPGYSVPSKSVSSIGIATTADVTATAPGTGYTFAGWTLTHCVRTDNNGATSRSITIRSDGSGSAATAQANYEEVLTSNWHIIGEPNTIIPNGWTANDDNMLMKASGSSTSSAGSLTINVKTLPANSSDYQFKVYNDNTDTPYGWSNEDYYWVNATSTTGVYSSDSHPLYFIPNALGEYTFAVNWSSNPSLTVTFPTSYAVNFGQGSGTAGSASATYSSTSFTSGTKVQDGKSITLSAPSASSGYSWDGWYNASSGGTRVSTSNPLTTTISSSNHDFYARYTEATYTVAFNDGDHGTVSPSGDQQVGAGGKNITAYPSAGYMFSSWSKTGANVTLSSTSTNPTTVTAAGTGSVTANYEQRFVLRGSTRAADATTAGMAGWSATDNDSYSSFSVAGNVITIEASLNASTEYKFKIWDKYGSGAWRGQTGDGSMSDGDTWTFDGSNDVFFTTTFAGTYTFDIDVSTATAPSVTLTYPLAHTLTYSIGSVSGTSGSISTSPSTASGSLVEHNHTVTLTGPAPKTGYRWKGWYTNEAGTEGKIADTDRAITLTMDDDYTVYACYEAKTYTVTLNHKGGTSGPSNPTVTYDAKPTDLASIPSKTSYGFDGYWTQDGSSTGDYGVQVIDGTGKWKSGVAYNTDASGNWIHDDDQTYYAKWLAVGYYVVGGPGLDNWVTNPAKLFSGSPLKLELALNKSSFESNKPTLTALFKIREVKEGASSTDVWFGKGANDGDVSFGKYNPTEEDLNTSGHNMQLEVYYNGTYTFKISNIDATPNLDLTVEVPVIDQLQIYSGCDGTVDAYYNWDGDPVENVVSKTVTLDNCTDPDGFYFKAVYDSEYYGKNSTTLTRASSSATDLSTSGGNILIKTDVKGDYTFNYDVSTHAISVTYPDKYQINYSAVTLQSGTGQSAAPTATNDDDDDEAVANGGYVADGYSVTFHAKTANTGYHFKGWFSKNNPSNWTDGVLATTADYTAEITANTTVYAVYSEDTLTVTVNATTGGSITTPSGSGSTVGAHPATTTPIVAALADASWYFTGWTVTSGSASFGDASAMSTTVTTTAAATIQANFARRYELRGSLTDNSGNGGMPGWGDNDAVFTGTVTSLGTDNGVNLTCTRTLDPNSAFKFVVHDRKTNKNMGYDPSFTDISDQSLLLDDQDHEVAFYTAGRGSYTFKITKLSNDANQYPTVSLERQASHLVSIGQGYVDIDGNATSNDDTGGTISAEATESSIIVDIANGKYIANGGRVDWTVDPATGYTLEKYYGADDFSGVGFTFTYIDPVNAAVNVYAKFVETPTAVTIRANYSSRGTVTVGGADFAWNSATNVGVDTHRDIVVTPNAGYYFARWELSDTPDFTLDNNTGDEDNEVTLKGLGAGTAGTLTAVFEPLEEIYFRNEYGVGRLWDVNTIYAYFNVSWIDGSGYGGTAGAGNSDASKIKCIQLTPVIEGSTTFIGYVPRSVTKAQGNSTINIAFSDTWMGTGTYPDGTQWNKFHNGKGVFRTDYNKKLNMYVPYHVKSGTSNSTDYYDTGFWKVAYIKQDESIGYYIKDNNNTEVNLGEFKGVQDYRSVGEAVARIDYTDTRKLYIVSAGGEYYKLVDDPTVTHLACTNLTMEKDGSKAGFNLTPSTEGYYTFRIEMYGDQMKLYVEYPVGPGDYRLEHTYNTGANKTHSDIIKNTKAETQKRYSMYLNTTGSPTLKLQECTSINKTTLQPVWADVTNATANLSAITSALSENGSGVYQFDLSIDTTNDVVRAGSVDSVRLYTGPYYIKTDCAPGSWANYKNNAMTLNTINYKKTDPNTFDYYFCSWIGDAGTNIKCVIANDYSTQLSDTLIDDAILGSGVQTMPYAGNVRFSYNSYTNDIKRAYLNGSSNYHDKFLWLEGYNSKVDADPSTDGVQTTNKLTDKGNWTYMLDIQAQETARARLTAKFGNNDASGKVQSLIGDKDGDLSASNTVEILGGSSSSVTWNDIRLIYDFKTNHLMSAWLVPSGEDSESKAINTDILILRENQDPARQITFASASDKLTEVDTVYAALCITKSHMTDITGERPADVYARRAFYWVSFPFDVKISDIFGSAGTFGEDWIMQTYNGKRRAEKGYWIDSESNWDFMNFTDTLKAGHGYVVTLDIGEFAEYSNKWANSVNEVYLYFPSISRVGTIDQENRSINLGNPSDYECNISRNSRNVYDSYWHCIGAPSFAENTRLANDPRPSWYDADPEHGIQQGELPDSISHWTTNLLFVYEYDAAYDYLQPRFYGAGKQDFTFKPMYSYLVQYKQEYIDWTNVVTPKQSIVARRARQTNEISDITFRLELTNGTKMLDQAFVLMSDDEAITNNYDFNYDLAKESNSGRANLWTLTADTIKAAANCLPLSEQTTIIPVGVKTTAAGDYTFTIPNGTNGVGIVLIDNIAGTRTNLSLTDYTVNLAKGTIDGRFMLEISPIAQTPTGMQNTGAGVQDDVHKVVVDGILYIVKDGVVYDAQGKRVQ